jgi:hypothetical protein
MNRSLVFDLATAGFIAKREDALFLGPGGTGKSHLAQAIGQAAIQQGYRVLYRETHVLLDDLAEAIAEGTRKEFMESLTTVPLLIIDDFGMRKLPLTAAEDLLEIIMRRYERASTLLTSNRPVEDWGKLLGDVAAVTAMLDRLLHHGHVLKCGPRSWRTKTAATNVAVAALPTHPTQEAMKYQSQTRLVCGGKDFHPPFPFPPGESRGGDGSPHGANCAPPPARGISKRSAEIPLARSPCPARGGIEKCLCLPECRPARYNIIWSWVWFRWPVLK